MGAIGAQRGPRRQPTITPDTPDRIADAVGLALFHGAMQDKMIAAAACGRHGWHDPEVVSDRELCDMLRAQLIHHDRPDYVDIANLAMMCWNRARMREQGHV